MAMAGSVSVKAGNFGVTGGASFLGIDNAKSGRTAGYHAGLTYKFKLPAGFAIQPSLLYHMKSSSYGTGAVEVDFNVGYVELPVSLQWGPDLLLFRPFIDVSPFIGYGVNHELGIKSIETPDSSPTIDGWQYINRLEYGLGLGGGIEIWKFQITCRYNWNFGPLLDADNKVDVSSILKNELGEDNFGGVTLSLALLF